MAIERLDPNSDSSAVEWVPTPATADEYTRCNDGSDATYCSTISDYVHQRFGVDNTSDSSGQTINHVDLIFRGQSTTDNDDIRFECNPVGTIYYSSDEPISNAGIANYEYEWLNNPEDSEAWESTDIDACEFGVISRDITGEMFMHQLWVNADYVLEISTIDSADSGAISESTKVSLLSFARESDASAMSENVTLLGPAPAGSVCWGHVTGVTQENTRTFTANWSGTGTIESSGDGEVIMLDDSEYMESDVINVGAGTVTIARDDYQGGYGSPTIKYKNGSSYSACIADSWNAYSTPFLGDGYVQIRVEEL